MEILFLLDISAAISVLNLATFTALAANYLLFSRKPNSILNNRTFTIANKAEAAIFFNIFFTGHNSIDYQFPTLAMPFAVAKNETNPQAKPFSEEHIKFLYIENMSRF